jgi:hypothetical protein
MPQDAPDSLAAQIVDIVTYLLKASRVPQDQKS